MAPASLNLVSPDGNRTPLTSDPRRGVDSLEDRRRAAEGKTRVFFGRAPVDRLTMEQASAWLLAQLANPSCTPRLPYLVMGPNAFLVTLARKDDRFAEALAHASLCLPDGMSVVWGSRLLGKSIPERVTGGEFMERMCALLAHTGQSVYFLGGLPGAASKAAEILASRYPGLVIAGADCPPKGFEQDESQNKAVLARIRAARPALLCVALGAPKQEVWMLDHCSDLPIGAALSVGAAFDTQAGFRKRAPAWTHAVGAEWLYRLALEPRRLWKRYLIGNALFAGVIVEEWIHRRKHRAATQVLKSPLPVLSGHDQREPAPPSLLSGSHAQGRSAGD